MIKSEVNMGALQDAVKLLVGDQGYEIVARVYGVMDVAERRGYDKGYETAARDGFTGPSYDQGYAEGYENGVKDGVSISDCACNICQHDEDGLIHIPGIGLVSAKATQLNYADEETIAVAEALSDLTDQGFYDVWSQRFHQ